ncbi:MAG: DinB family protein [bacterium]
MDATTIILTRLKACDLRINEAMGGLSEADLLRGPAEHDNPIGWMMWHMTRFEDSSIARITGEPQVWIAGEWHEKFGMDGDPANNGVGHAIDQVRAFRPAKEDLLGYYNAVREKTAACLNRLTPADLDEERPDFMREGAIQVGIILERFFADQVTHVGQICYLRGHFQGWGLYPR